MNKKVIATFVVMLIALAFLLVYTSIYSGEEAVRNSYPVANLNTGLHYRTIQSAIDAPETLVGHMISVDSGLYNESVVINKQLSLVGEGPRSTIIDGNASSVAVRITANRVLLRGFTVMNSAWGIYVDSSNDSRIEDNNVTRNIDFAVIAQYTNNLTLTNNIASNSSTSGIVVSLSSNFSIANNIVFGNRGGYGINANVSTNGLISRNQVFQNGIGIYLYTFDSSVESRFNCTVAENNVTENLAIGLAVGSNITNYRVFRNNFVKNPPYSSAKPTGSFGQWDDGIEGNYWQSNNLTFQQEPFTFVDSNLDGINDTSYVIDANNIDRYPLVGPFFTFEPFKDVNVNMITDSSLTSFLVGESYRIILNVTNLGADQTTAFIRAEIPQALLANPLVLIDNLTELKSRLLLDNGEATWVYFSFSVSTAHQLQIYGQVPSVDQIVPSASIIAPQPRIYTGEVELSFAVDKTVSDAKYRLDNQQNLTLTGNITLTGLSSGFHQLVIYVTDIDGNSAASKPAYFSVSLPIQYPVIVWIFAGIATIAAVATVGILIISRSKAKAELRKIPSKK